MKITYFDIIEDLIEASHELGVRDENGRAEYDLGLVELVQRLKAALLIAVDPHIDGEDEEKIIKLLEVKSLSKLQRRWGIPQGDYNGMINKIITTHTIKNKNENDYPYIVPQFHNQLKVNTL